jgi:hypothetical protein
VSIHASGRRQECGRRTKLLIGPTEYVEAIYGEVFGNG